MLRRLFSRAAASNVQKATEAISQIRQPIDAESIEKQISLAVQNGTLPTYERAIEELKQKSGKSKLDIRDTRTDHTFYMQSFGYIRELAKSGEEVPQLTDPGYDEYLQDIWVKEPLLSGAVYSMSAKMTALNWQITGKRDIALEYAKLLARAMYSTDGAEWGGFISGTAQDFYTTNKGAFWELVKQGSPLYGKLLDIGHIDSLNCELTGNSKVPVVYRSSVTGQVLHLKVGEFAHFSSMPSPREDRFGAGYCAVGRAIRAAKLLMGLHDYDEEKLANLPPEGVAAVTGLTKDEFKSAITLWKAEREANNALTFPQVLWLIGSQPNVDVKLDFIGFSQLPESFNREEVVTQYVNTLALVFGVDAREFWPISTSSLGTAAESEIQHMKAKGKGPGEFLSITERHINGELPDDADFEYDTQDVEEDMKAATIAKAWIDAYLPLLTGGKPAPAPVAGGEPGAMPVGGGGGGGEPLVDKDIILRILADKGILPNEAVGDSRVVVQDVDVHIKENSAPDSCFYWTKGILKEKRLPPIQLYSKPIDYHSVPDAVINMPEFIYKESLEDLEPADGVFTVPRKEIESKELERNIKGKPIPVKEVTRGASVTQKAIQDELNLWRTVKDLNLYAIEEEEQEEFITRTTKK